MKKGYIQKNDKGEYYCPTCNTYKVAREFGIQSRNKHRDGLRQICNTCRPVVDKAARFVGSDIKRQLKCILKNSKCRRKNDLTLNDLVDLYDTQNGLCAITGLEMTSLNGSGNVQTNVSIDRIDSSRGYDIYNIQLVQCRVNKIKSDMTIEELLYYCKHIIEKHEQ